MRCRVGRRWVAPLCALCLLVAVGGLAVGPGESQSAADADAVVLEVNVETDGDARWRVEYRHRLANETDEAAFDRLERRIADEPDRYTTRFAERVRPAIGRAANETGRDMALENLSVTVGREPIPQGTARYGTVTYRYTWTAFAAADGDRLRIGDAIDGFYVSERSELLVTWPTTYEAIEVVPSPDERRDRRVVWTGELTFADDEPRLSLDPDTATDSASGDGPAADGGLPVVAVGAAALALAGLATGGTVLLRRRRGEQSGAEPVDPELLSPRERVQHALADNGGRMKQQELAETCDWHPSKTSKVLSDLQEEGAVDVFRLGRENVVTLPEEDLTDDQ